MKSSIMAILATLALAACGMTPAEQLCLGGKAVAAGVSGAVGDSEDRAVKEAWSTSDAICADALAPEAAQ